MMDLSTAILTYLAAHAVIIIGALFTFALKIERRLTRLETKVEQFEKKLQG